MLGICQDFFPSPSDIPDTFNVQQFFSCGASSQEKEEKK